MQLACLDLEGVLVPEIWIRVAESTGIEALRLTTRDIADYDELMGHRLSVLKEHGVTLSAIQSVIAQMGPMTGAADFLDRLRRHFQVVILSDTFYEFAMPLMAQLGYPTLLCHRLRVRDDRVVGYTLRQPDSKRAAVRAFHGLNFQVVAAGDSYNDTAHAGRGGRRNPVPPAGECGVRIPSVPGGERLFRTACGLSARSGLISPSGTCRPAPSASRTARGWCYIGCAHQARRPSDRAGRTRSSHRFVKKSQQ